MVKLADLPLEELYARPKITLAVEEAICSKEDFSKVQPNYCSKVCKLKCKTPDQALFQPKKYDILIIQDHRALPDLKYGTKTWHQQQRTVDGIVRALAIKAFARPDTYFLTNVLKCPISSVDMKKDKGPSVNVIMKCRPYLLNEIQRYKPKVIISLSTTVTKALGIVNKANFRNRGEIHKTPDGIPVVLTLHPKTTMMIRQNSTGKMWGPDYWGVILKDFQKAEAILQGEYPLQGLDKGIERVMPRIHVTGSLEGVKKACSMVSEAGREGIVSFDTETTGLDPWSPTAKLLTIQFGFKINKQYEAVVIPLWHRENKLYDPKAAWDIVVSVLVDPAIRKIGHNLKFDVLYIYATTGCRVAGIINDTMLSLHCINSGVQGNYGLKTAVWDWIPETDLGGYEDKLPKLTTEIEEEQEEESAE